MAAQRLSMAEWAAFDPPLRGGPMATVLFVGKATIRKDQEEAFNRWYNEAHVPQVLQIKGLVSARRYKALEGEDEYQYMAVYELQDDAIYRHLLVNQRRTAH